MPNLKSKWLKPSRNVPYAEGILVYNGTGSTIAANLLVRIDGSGLQGGGLKMAIARATTAQLGGKVPLFVTKHSIPDGKWGVVLPWAILQNVDTSAAANAGDAVYLRDAATGVWDTSAGTVGRAVGIVLTKDASTGVVWLCPGMFNFATI